MLYTDTHIIVKSVHSSFRLESKKCVLVRDCIKDSSKTPLKKNILKADQTVLETLLPNRFP